jgi:hypothetical protein
MAEVIYDLWVGFDYSLFFSVIHSLVFSLKFVRVVFSTFDGSHEISDAH